MKVTQLEKRLKTIEQEIARLKASRIAANGKMHPVQALQAIHGVFEDDEAFREAARLGRQWRRSSGGTTRASKAKRK
jgi:hypothetical protein